MQKRGEMKFITLFTLLMSLMWVNCAGRTIESEERDISFAGDFKVHRYTLKNGLKVLILPDASSPTLAYQTWFNIGSRHETVGYTGMAHLFEHMMFRETKNLPPGEFDRTLRREGGQGINAFTSFDYTGYVQELPSDKLDLIARLEADRLTNLVVNEEAFQIEREVVHNERRMRRENNPAGLMIQELFGTLYQHHPYHWPIIGYEEDLNRMTHQDALAFYKEFYIPNRATIVITGDVNPRKAIKIIEKYYAKIPAGEIKSERITSDAPQKEIRRKRLELNMPTEKLYIAYRVPHILHEDIPALELMTSILSSGKSSRLKRSLVDTGIATSGYAWNYSLEHESPFILGADLQENRSASVAESVILRELARLRTNLVSNQELERARNLLKFQFYLGLNSNPAKARFLGRYELAMGKFERAVDFYDQIDQITPEHIQKVATKYFSPEQRTVIIGVPKK
jgi:zinc protease